MIAYLVTFPVETQLAILGLVGLLVNLALGYLGNYAPWSVPFLQRWKDELTALIAGGLTGWLATNLPGGNFEQVSILGVNLVIALLVALLAHGVRLAFRSAKVKTAY